MKSTKNHFDIYKEEVILIFLIEVDEIHENEPTSNS